jgi:hypothetical protein
LPKGREPQGDGVPIVVVGVKAAKWKRPCIAPPGKTGKPFTGQSGTGNLMTGTEEVREMRTAETVLNIIRELNSRNRLLESRVIRKSVKRGSGRGGWKRAKSVPRWPPTLRQVRFLGGWGPVMAPGHPTRLMQSHTVW